MDKDVLEYMSKVKDYYLGKSNLNTEEVVKILLGENKTFSKIEDKVIASNISNLSEFDMEELLRWKNKNNDKYEITSYWAITSHRKYIGKFLVLGKKIVRKLLKWYVNPIIEQQNEFNGSVTASINALYNNEVVTQDFIRHMKINKALEEKLKHLEEDISKLGEKINQLGEENIELRKENQLVMNNLEALMMETKKLDGNAQMFANKTENITQDLLYRGSKIDEELDYIKYNLSKLNKNKAGIKENNIKKDEKVNEQVEKNDSLTINQYGIDYFEFENRFRGIRADIKNRQTIYLKYFTNKNNVLDIGCGRGEFLELLDENNVNAKGIDVCKDFIEYCEYKKLDVALEDGISYLNKTMDNSVGGIFMSQVAEHLETDYFIELVTKVYNKLERGAYFIAETPNPVMLSTFSNSFYIDPSHKNPVHPETFKFILEKSGFKDIQIIFTEGSKTEYKLPLLDGKNINNIEEFNNGINHLNKLLFDSQDYAIIGRK
jgi:O-antigen chain-terminating methyltransferase